jgi:hypothetical protein
MIVVTMTSWIKRIDSVKKVVESIMGNTVKPDKVYLNLSRYEFDSNGVQLPTDLVDYFNSDDRLIINWVDGENIKSMKKVFPILEYLDDDDIIITADDDIIFPTDLIESRINDFNKFDKKYSITSNKSPIGIFNNMNVASAVSLYTKRMLKNWNKYVDSDIIGTYNDDRTYVYILWLNGFLNKSCSRYDVKELLKSYSLNMDDTGLSNNKQIIVAKKYDVVANKRLKKMSTRDIKDMFGFFHNLVNYDCVMVYGKSGIDSQEMTCGDHLEMEYVIASLKRYCSSWVGRIFIVGSEPPERVKKDVIHIPCDNPYMHCKDANIIHKVRYACENIQDLSDDFLMISDDQIVTKESSWDDMKPRIVRKFTDWTAERWGRNRKVGFWHECLYNTLNLFPKDNSCFWEPHIWSPINKQKFLKMCDKYDYEHNTDCIIFSLYYNFIEQDVIRGFDHLHLENSKAKKRIDTLTLDSVPRHLSWADNAFSDKRFRDILDVIVGFKENSGDLNSNSNTKGREMIQKLREGIRNGTIVKEMKPDGSYIWRKVRK